MEQYFSFVKTGNKDQIDPWLAQFDAAYAAGNQAISDETYDRLISTYESRFGKRTVVGAPPIHSEVKLPIAMMSLDKVMKEKELQLFVTKNSGEYVVMDKVNGNAGLYEVIAGKARLYNRGDGSTGSDLSHILQYLNLPMLPFNVHIKGELVVDKKDYEPFKDDYKTNLSMVAGLLNSQSADPQRLKLIKFVAYDMSFPSNQNIELNMIQTLEHLVKYGFRIPFCTTVKTLSIEWLSAFFKQQKANQVYDVDGMVVVTNRPIKYSERLVRENPKYAIAFKEYGETAIATVSEIIWEASKHRVIKPVVKIEPVTINSFTIKSLTAFNAGWVWDNKVGPGSKILITHNTIPHILDVVERTEPQMPSEDLYPAGSWEWNDTHVDIVLLEENDEIKIARIYEFFKQIGAKYWGETTISKLYKGGFTTVKTMLESSKEDFLSKNIDGIGDGIIDRMIKTREEALPTVDLAVLMSASCCFGMGFGQRRLKAITDIYPNILNMNITVQEIMEIDGFAQKTAEKFIEGVPVFKKFLEEIPLLQKVLAGEVNNVVKTPVNTNLPAVKMVAPITNSNGLKEDIRGKSFVFTGFRDKALENMIQSRGGEVKTGVSKKVNYVVVGGVKGEGSAKEKKAMEYGIPVLNLEELRITFGL
jgi:NAD-dependent DNA ligase